MNNIQKLFSERIEVFTSVDFNKVSVPTGIVKIALKVIFLFTLIRSYKLLEIELNIEFY